MIKYTTEYHEDVESNIGTLRKKYPNFYFKTGMRKGVSTLFILRDLTTKEYSEPVESVEYPNHLFYPPKDKVALETLEKDKDLDEFKLTVNLRNGEKLKILPASAEPKKILFGVKSPKEDENPFTGTTEYAKIAYKMYARMVRKEEISLDSEEVKDLILAGIKRSYDIPLDLLNHMDLVSYQDLDPLLAATMGINEEYLKKN